MGVAAAATDLEDKSVPVPSGAAAENPDAICRTLNIARASARERETVCKALRFIIGKLRPYGFGYKHDSPITQVVFHDTVILADDVRPSAAPPQNGDLPEGIDANVYAATYVDETRSLHIMRYEAFKALLANENFKIDRATWEGVMVHEMMHYFTHVNGNYSVFDFYNEALSYYMEIEYIGFAKAAADRGYPADGDYDYELSADLYGFSPIFYSLAGWHWVKQDPAKRIPDIISGDVNFNYLDRLRTGSKF